MEIMLLSPFEHNDKKIEKCTLKRKEVKVIDRIKAKTEAKAVFGDDKSDGYLVCLVNRLCDFGVDLTSLELAEKLSAEDLDNIVMKIYGIDDNFLQYLAKTSESL